MDLATLIGLIGGFCVVGAAVALSGSTQGFVDVPAMLLVFAGSFMVVMMRFGLGQFLGALNIAMQAFVCKTEKPAVLIKQAIEIAGVARKSGLLALEDIAIDNAFFKKGIALLVDGIEAGIVRSTLIKEKIQGIERHEIGYRVFKSLADVGPAMGMIGTLIGLVQMLSAMDDPKSIGPAMAVALLTTLYGALQATLIAGPIADKLALKSKEEELSQALLIDAIMGIQAGQNPRVLEDLLKAYLPGSQRELTDVQANATVEIETA